MTWCADSGHCPYIAEVTTSTVRASSGTLVAAAMMGMNVAIYVFTVAAARLLVPAELGTLVALLNVLLMGNVVSLALQAATARRIAIAPDERPEIVRVVVRVAAVASLAVGVVVATATLVLTPLLRFDSVVPVVLAGVTLVPLTIMGAQAGIAQGSERWRSLSAIYLANGVGRLVCGSIAMLVADSATAAMAGIAVGAWLPVLVGSRLVRTEAASARTVSRRSFVRETLTGSHALLAYFVLSSLDALVARNRFDAHDAGLYAAGLILTKAAMFAPQFVSVVVFPALARDETRRARALSVLAVAGVGLLATAATAVLPRLALVLVGGSQYEDVADQLWLFALSGSCLAVVHLLVFDALARHAHGVVVLVWAGAAAVVGLAYGLDVHLTGLVSIVAGVSAVIAVVVWFVPGRSATVTAD